MNFLVLLLLLSVTVCLNADSEYATHGTPSKNSKDGHNKKGQHDPEFDHQAVLGKPDLEIRYI
jgi:hypothetical protein